MIFLIALTILGSDGSKLDRTEINNSIKGISSIPLQNNGVDGIWLSKVDAEKLFILVSERLPLALDIIDNQTNQIDFLKKSMDLYKLSLMQYKEIAELNGQMYSTAMENLLKLQPPELAWYESPKATFIYGFLVGAATIIGSALVINWAMGGQWVRTTL